MLSIVFGFLAAVFWGFGDFIGGMVSRKVSALRAVFLSEIVGMPFLFAAVLIMGERFPVGNRFWIAFFAGAVGTVGLVILYHALTIGLMSIATPVSALLSAALPVAVGVYMDGLPGIAAMFGFFAAFAAVWLISQDNAAKVSLKKIGDLTLPLMAGLCFGMYFVFIHTASSENVIWPMIAGRTGGMVVVLIAMAYTKTSILPDGETPWGMITVNSVMDIFGNGFYITAGQLGRMDIASVLGAMYPGGTVLLAWRILKEKLSPMQWAGIGLALVAILLLTI